MAPIKYHYGRFPPLELDWSRLLPFIGPANAAVARYDGVLQGIPNTTVLLSPLISQEAVLSSKIEGTQATLGEVLEFEAEAETATGEKRDSILEVLNYRRAMTHAVNAIKSTPLCQRVIRGSHQILLDGVRGQNRTPGEYRKIPNWIGTTGCNQESARFVPPDANRIPHLISEWEKYLHSNVPDKLVQLAVLHAEFESIHPFLDGNGRLGRLLVPLFLVDKKLLSTPTFFISAYLETHQDEYYTRLYEVSQKDAWTDWCIFFLKAIIEQSRDNEAKATSILRLYREKKDWIAEITHSHLAVQALDWFFEKPIFKTSDFVASSGIPKPTAQRIVRLVRKHGLLRELRAGAGRRPSIFAFKELLNIAQGKNIF